MPSPQPESWLQILRTLTNRENLTAAQTSWVMAQVLEGRAEPVHLGAFLAALRTKGETVAELRGLADTMLSYAVPLDPIPDAVDIVGSGGDMANTVNISTMAAIIAAAAGARVVKHGNRAATSQCGTADVLEALGVVLDLPPVRQRQVIEETGIGFLFAAVYNPAFRHASQVRRDLGVPTTFNVLGPLTNPGRPRAHAVGLANPELAPLVAGVFAERGDRAVVFHGGDGLDELTTTTSSQVWIVADGHVSESRLDPQQLGLARAQVHDLVGAGPGVNAQVLREVAAAKPGPVLDIAVLNAAAGLLAFAGPQHGISLVDQLAGPLSRAQLVVTEGAMATKLAEWVDATAANTPESLVAAKG